MKLRFLQIALLACFTAFSANAQTYHINEAFDNGIPDDWQTVDLDGFTIHSEIASYFSTTTLAWSTLCYSDGSDCFAVSTSYYTNPSDQASDWLITPMIKLTANNFVSWAGQAANGTYADGYSVILMFADTSKSAEILFTTTGENAEETTRNADLSDWEGDSVQIAFWNNSTNMYMLFIDDVAIFEPTSKDLELTTVDFENYVSAGTHDITGSVKNLGLETITEYVIHYTVDGGTAQSKTITTSLDLNESEDFTITDALDLSTSKTYEIVVWIETVNGSTDGVTSNDEKSGSTSVLSTVPTKNVLVEEFTGAWCGWCPDGAYILETITEGNDNIIGVAVHSGDDMQIAEASGVLDFAPGYPSGVVDRTLFEGQSEVGLSRGSWETYANARLSAITPVAVTGDISYDENATELTANIKATFYGNLTNTDIRLSAIVIEDSVTGSGSGYDQENYLSGRSGYESNPYYNEPSTITGYNHMKVVRAYLGGVWGESGIVTSSVTDQQAFTKTFTFDVDTTEIDINNVRVVFVAQDYNSDETKRNILNAAEVSFETGDNITELNTLSADVFPNPATDMINVNYTVENTGDVTVSIVNLQGQLVKRVNYGRNNNGYFTRSIDVSDLNAGAYIINISNEDAQFNQPLNIVK